MLALSAACTSSGRPGGGTPGSARVTLRVPANTEGGGHPTPYASSRGPARLISTYIFDTLAFPDVTGEPKPWLATSWTSSADGKTWKFSLNDRATFHDGKPVTSEDVVFTFEYNLTGPGAATGVAQGVTYIDSVTAPDRKTVVIQLRTVRPSFLHDVAGTFGFAVMPKHIWEPVTDPAAFRGPTSLIGSGPYRLEDLDPTANRFNFVANERFYLGPARVREVQMVPVADALLALERGEVDAASGADGVIPKARYDALATKYTVLTAPGEFNLALFFNPLKGFPYNQKAFRQGVAYGLDRKDMVQRLLDGRGVPGSAGALGPGNPFLNKSLPPYDHDEARAMSLFDQINLRDRDGDGLRDRPDGSSFTVPLSVSASDTQQAQLVKEYLRAVGIDVALDIGDQQTSDARGATGDYEMAIQHFGGLSGDPSDVVSRFAWNSSGTTSAQVHGYNNPNWNKVVTDQAVEVDRLKRGELVNQIQAILAEDLPQLSLYVPEQISFVDDKKFQGFAYTPGCPPCGVTGNKRLLHSGNAEPAQKN